MKIVVTGGHFSPAYAVIKKLRKENDILVIGRRYAFEGDQNETYEYKICQKEGIAFEAIVAGRLQRKFTKYTIRSAGKFPLGVYDALKKLRAFKPDVVVTFGGYIGLPVAIAASILRIPVVLHEQTQKAGLSSRLISKFASVVLVSFVTSRKYFRGKNTILTGNPIREEILVERDVKKFHSDFPLIYITGGSTGAHALNMFVAGIIPELVEKFKVIHQSGSQADNDYDALVELKNKLPVEKQQNYSVERFFSPQEVSYLLKKAVLVVSRSGVNIITELMALGTIGLLIPLPYGQQNEQKENARLFASTGLGEYILQENLTGEMLLEKMRVMIKEQKRYKHNAKNALQYVRLDATEKIIEQIYIYGRREKRGNSTSPKKTESIIF